ncbi:macro domain protein [Parvimonas sp. oral taxon 110 str. F0139]|nr:macro domain protein [Parvimonas sp. oral taxon 110 str. F0139]
MNRNKEQMLDFLVKAFIADSDNYKNMEILEGETQKRVVLRSLMNIRIPRKMDDEVLKVQDEYLKLCAEEKGIVELKDISIIKDIFSIWQGDITRLKVDAIFNAANSIMLGCWAPMHLCIDNQIHTFAGIQLRAECNEKMQKLKKKYGQDYEQPTAVPMLTDAYNLPSKKVIHIVGPIVYGELTKELEKELADCYEKTLDMCLENGLKSVAFCCISTGEFRFPKERAAEIAIGTTKKWVLEHPKAMDRIIFNVFKDEDKKYYEEMI